MKLYAMQFQKKDLLFKFLLLASDTNIIFCNNNNTPSNLINGGSI